MFDYSKSLIFTENNCWVPLLLSNNKKLFDLILTKLENSPLNFALLISTSAQLFNPSSTVVDVPPKI